MPKVSVVVPVYNPGSLIDDCIRSLLDQSLAAEEYEVIFVDDGSTDETPARLDELARAHPHVHVRHIPNSGWPGRPRNIGMDMARGDYVLFVDNDDWIEREALERMHATAVRDDADIVLGKVVGHGKPVPPTLFTENRSGMGIEWPPLAWLLTPHRLFRRSLLQAHGLRFPEGRRRLEDHVFVLGALFRTNRVSVLADYPCYHWILRHRQVNASADEFDPTVYYANLQEVLDVVDEHTEPGPLRDRLYLRWYRGKVLSRVGGTLFVNRAPQARRNRFAEIRELMERRFPPHLDDHLPLSLRVRAALVRSGTVEQLERLAELETRLDPQVATAAFEPAGDEVALRLELTIGDAAGLLRFEPDGDGMRWRPPDDLAGGLPAGCLDAAGAFDGNHVHVLIRPSKRPEEFLLPATVRTRAVPDDAAPGLVRVALDIDVRFPTGSAAAGRPLSAGEHVLRVIAYVAGFRLDAPVTRGGDARLVIAVDGDSGASIPRRTWKQQVAARAPGVRRAAVRARKALRAR